MLLTKINGILRQRSGKKSPRQTAYARFKSLELKSLISFHFYFFSVPPFCFLLLNFFVILFLYCIFYICIYFFPFCRLIFSFLLTSSLYNVCPIKYSRSSENHVCLGIYCAQERTHFSLGRVFILFSKVLLSEFEYSTVMQETYSKP